MKKLRKSLFLSLAAVLSLSACSGGGGGSTAEVTDTSKIEFPASTTVKGEENQESYPIADGTKLSYWFPTAGSLGTLADYNDSEFFQWYEEKTGLKIDFIVPAAGTEKESFNLLFTSGDLPDIIYTLPGQYTYVNGMDAAIEDGFIADLTQYLDLCPNYVSWLNNTNSKKDVLTDTGKMYGFWGFWDNMGSGYADQGLAIRQDFLDKVGKDVPTTYAEWEDVLTAFKDELGIEAPFYTGKYGIDNGEFMAGYGVAPYFYQVDGTVKYGPLEEGYKEYLTMMHDWFEKGLLDPDFATRQSGGITADNDMQLNDKVGALIDYGTRMTDAYISRGASNTDFWLVAAEQPKKSASDPDPAWRMAGTNYHEMQGTCLLINAKSEHIEEAIKWVDGFYAKDVYLNANYGIDSEEGTVWNAAADGHRIGNYDFRYKNPDGLDSATVVAKYWSKNPPIRVEAAQIEQMPAERAASYDVWSKYEPKNYLPTNLTLTVDEGIEYAGYYSEIEAFVQESNVKFINGEKSLDDYDAYVETLKGMGIDRCVELQQAALTRYNARG